MPIPTSTTLMALLKTWGFIVMIIFSVIVSYIVVVMMCTPTTTKEWIVSLLSTVVVGIGGSAGFMTYFDMESLIDAEVTNPFFGWTVIATLIFLFGQLGWFLIRLLYRTIENNKDSDLLGLIQKIRNIILGRPYD